MDFQDTHPLGAGATAPRAGTTDTNPGPEPAATDGRPLAIRFTGSGSEYFRIWIVNLLLTLLTLGLYVPFARVRRLRYFHANTLIDGHALGFHGNPWQMLRGVVLVGLFALCYAGALQASPLAGAVALVALAALWPALWHSSLRFRLAQTSWRGLRLRFDGTAGGAYRALLPTLLPAALLMALSTIAGPTGALPFATGAQAAALTGALLLALLALAPLTLARMKRYQHDHFHYAGETSRLTAPTRAFYGLALRCGLVALAPLAAMALVAAGVTLAGAVLDRTWQIALITGGVALGYLALLLLVQPCFSAGLQNLAWGHTRSPRLSFDSRLRFGALLRRMLLNFALLVLTLGLYWPFAAVALARLRLEAVSLRAEGDVAAWTARAAARQRLDTAGDAAGDALGVELGL